MSITQELYDRYAAEGKRLGITDPVGLSNFIVGMTIAALVGKDAELARLKTELRRMEDYVLKNS